MSFEIKFTDARWEDKPTRGKPVSPFLEDRTHHLWEAVIVCLECKWCQNFVEHRLPFEKSDFHHETIGEFLDSAYAEALRAHANHEDSHEPLVQVVGSGLGRDVREWGTAESERLRSQLPPE